MISAIDLLVSRTRVRDLDVYIDDFTIIQKGRPERIGSKFVQSVIDLAYVLEEELEFKASDIMTSYAATHKYTQDVISKGLTRFAAATENKSSGVDMRNNSRTSKVYPKRKRDAV